MTDPHPSLLRELSGKEPMPKVNVLSLPRPTPRTVTRTFTDPERPEYPITMTLRSLQQNPHAFLVAQDAAKAFAEEFSENWYPHPSGEAIRITESVAQYVCLLEAMQVGGPEEVYNRDECLGILVSLPGAWVEISKAVSELSEPAKKTSQPDTAEENGHAPNSSRVPASTSCAPSATASSGTPTS